MKPSLYVTAIVSILLAAAFPLAINPQDSATVRFSYPEKQWVMEMSQSQFAEFKKNSEGEVQIFSSGSAAMKPAQPVSIFVRMERAKEPGDAQALREIAKKKLRKTNVVVQESVKLLMHDDVPIIRYSTDAGPLFNSGMGGASNFPRMKSFQAFYVKDDVWITLTLNFFVPKKEDESFFQSLLDTIRIVEQSSHP